MRLTKRRRINSSRELTSQISTPQQPIRIASPRTQIKVRRISWDWAEPNPLWQPPHKFTRYQDCFGTPPKLLEGYSAGLHFPLHGLKMVPKLNPFRMMIPNPTPRVEENDSVAFVNTQVIAANLPWITPVREQIVFLPISADLASCPHASHSIIGLSGICEKQLELTDGPLSWNNFSSDFPYLNLDGKDPGESKIGSSQTDIEKKLYHSRCFERYDQSFTGFNLLPTDLQFNYCCQMSDDCFDVQWGPDQQVVEAILGGCVGSQLESRAYIEYMNSLWTFPRHDSLAGESLKCENEAIGGKLSDVDLRGNAPVSSKSAMGDDISWGIDDIDNECQDRTTEMESQITDNESEELWSTLLNATHDNENTSADGWDLLFLKSSGFEETGMGLTNWVGEQIAGIRGCMERASTYGPMRLRGGVGGQQPKEGNSPEKVTECDGTGQEPSQEPIKFGWGEEFKEWRQDRKLFRNISQWAKDGLCKCGCRGRHHCVRVRVFKMSAEELGLQCNVPVFRSVSMNEEAELRHHRIPKKEEVMIKQAEVMIKKEEEK